MPDPTVRLHVAQDIAEQGSRRSQRSFFLEGLPILPNRFLHSGQSHAGSLPVRAATESDLPALSALEQVFAGHAIDDRMGLRRRAIRASGWSRWHKEKLPPGCVQVPWVDRPQT